MSPAGALHASICRTPDVRPQTRGRPLSGTHNSLSLSLSPAHQKSKRFLNPREKNEVSVVQGGGGGRLGGHDCLAPAAASLARPDLRELQLSSFYNSRKHPQRQALALLNITSFTTTRGPVGCHDPATGTTTQ